MKAPARVTPPSPTALLLSPCTEPGMSGSGGLLCFFGRKWLTLPSPPRDGAYWQTSSSIKRERDHRAGLRGRGAGLGGKPVGTDLGRPPWRAPFPGHPLLKPFQPPHRTGPTSSPSEISLQGHHSHSVDVSHSHQSGSCSKCASSQLWQVLWPSLFIYFFSFFSLPFSCCCSALQNVIRK